MFLEEVIVLLGFFLVLVEGLWLFILELDDKDD